MSVPYLEVREIGGSTWRIRTDDLSGPKIRDWLDTVTVPDEVREAAHTAMRRGVQPGGAYFTDRYAINRVVPGDDGTSLRSERSAPFTPMSGTDVGSDGDGHRLAGYAAVFNTPTMITDKLGTYRELIAPGAFRRSLRTRDRVLMQFEHGRHATIGSIPIGRYTELAEDPNGLRVVGWLFSNELVRPVRDAVAGRAITGMSIKFVTNVDEWSRGPDGVDEVVLRDVDLHEAGPVTMPAYATTSITVG